MYQLKNILLLVLIYCGGLISWTSGRNSENWLKAARHGAKPGSIHQKARSAASYRSRAQSRQRNKVGHGATRSGGNLPDSENQSNHSNSSNLTQNQTFPGSQINAPSANVSTSNSSNDDPPSRYGQEFPGNANTCPNISSSANASQSQNPIANFPNSTTSQNHTLNSTSYAGPGAVGSLASDLPQNGLQKSDLFLGFLPDDGSSGGTRQTMAQLNSQIGKKAAVYGWYAQAHSGTLFDGSQLLAVIDDVKASKCNFQPAIMPVGGWQGLTSSDNSQAIAIANVLKKFTDEGITVWLRFAHEVNYYQTDGTYQGTAADFKAGWAAVAAAVKSIAPSVKMWWTPNVSTAEDYEAYEPDDMSTVDLVGIDYYPKQLKGNDFLDAMKQFHDKYAVDGRKFAIGETGLGWSGSINDKLQWFNQICEARSSLPQFLAMAWFNFDKEYDYKIAGEPTLNQKFTALLAY